MIEEHAHGTDGRVIVSEPATANPDVAEVAEVEAVSDAEVEIAKIEADRDIKLAKTDAQRAQVYATEELAEMRGELRALREIVDAMKPPDPPEAEPAPPVVVEEAPANPALDAPPPEETENTPDKPKKKSGHIWFG